MASYGELDCPAGKDDVVMHKDYSTQPDQIKTMSGPLDSPTKGTDMEGRAATDTSAENSQGTFPEGNPLKSPVEY